MIDVKQIVRGFGYFEKFKNEIDGVNKITRGFNQNHVIMHTRAIGSNGKGYLSA